MVDRANDVAVVVVRHLLAHGGPFRLGCTLLHNPLRRHFARKLNRWRGRGNVGQGTVFERRRKLLKRDAIDTEVLANL